MVGTRAGEGCRDLQKQVLRELGEGVPCVNKYTIFFKINLLLGQFWIYRKVMKIVLGFPSTWHSVSPIIGISHHCEILTN